MAHKNPRRVATRDQFETYVTNCVAGAVDNLADNDPDRVAVETRLRMNRRTEIIDRLSCTGLLRDEISAVTGMLKPNLRNYLNYNRAIYRKVDPFPPKDDLSTTLTVLTKPKARQAARSLHELLCDIIVAAEKTRD